MDADKLAIELLLKGMTQDQQTAALESIKESVAQAKAVQKQRIGENVQVVVQALKKLEADIREKYDGVTTVIEKRVATIKDGRDGANGKDGRDGKDGRNGKDGAPGPRGVDGARGMDGRDGEDGVSVTDAHIDFDGSLIISLSSGRQINVGEVVAPDLAEKIKVITNGGGTSQGVLDTLTSLQNQINVLVSMGSVNYVGTWNASTNTPTIVAGTGDKGDYYVVSVAGTTSIDGQALWGVGDWIIFNGTAWQKVDGGSTGDFTNLSASGTVTFSGGTANGVAYLNASRVVTTGSALTFNGTALRNTSGQFEGIDNLTLSSLVSTTNATIVTINSAGTAGTTRFQINNSEQMRLTSTGLGIGTTSPGGLLQVSTRLRVRNDGFITWGSDVNTPANTGYLTWDTGVAAIGFNGTGALRFDTSNLERARIDSAGNLLVGTTTNTNASRLVVNGTISETVGGVQYQVVSQADIGTGANEIPLNQYLGKLAYKDVEGLSATLNPAPTIASAATIQPLAPITFISGTTTINTITVPAEFVGGGQITLIPTGLWSTGTSGNIAIATTGVVSRALILTYDAVTTKWYPSY
jgi:hypothetical protein